MRKHKKHLDFELNLVPFIDLLSVCICFLLLTAVWLNVGSMNVKQAVGGQPKSETEKKPMVWVFLGTQGSMSFEVQDSAHIPANLRKLKIAGVDGKLSVADFTKALENIKKLEPNLRTALIQPQAQSVYEDIIQLMDTFKKSGVTDLGVVPL